MTTSKIKGIVFMPNSFKDYLVFDRYRFFFDVIKQEFGFDMQFTDKAIISKGTEVIITVKSPQHSNPGLLIDVNIDPKIKVIGIFADLHSKGNKIYEKNIIKMFNRCDVILTQCYALFKNWFPQYVNKCEFFPNFFASHDMYAKLPFNTSPKNKCLFSGDGHSKVYPLRGYLLKHINKKYIDILPHPPYHPTPAQMKSPKWFMGERYAKKLNEYACCFTASGKWSSVIAKYIEIPATGSLLIANEVEDLKKLGYVSGQHYVSITQDTMLNTIIECVNNPEKYIEIRKEGMEFVRNTLSVNNRIEQLKQTIERIL